jgi:hypothetical protein
MEFTFHFSFLKKYSADRILLKKITSYESETSKSFDSKEINDCGTKSS